ncbi:MAG TPA: BON domain-containing protein [Candidatus Acidoferrales bacterium]|nr:BON domain-containing protein [Candidatus Acidoferrales bacterium]
MEKYVTHEHDPDDPHHHEHVVERKVIVRRSSGIAGVLLLLLLALVGYFAYKAYRPGSTLADMLHNMRETAADTATTSKVQTALLLSKHVSPYSIHVETNQGVVTLTGQVPSEEVKMMAGAIAKDTSGVAEVHNELAVNPAAARDAEILGIGDRVRDLEIRIIVADGISKNAELKDKNIDTQVKKRVVTLNGKVDTNSQKYTAEQIAWAVAGVEKVENNLSVTSPEAMPLSADDKLAKRVEFELYSTHAFTMPSVHVRAENGTVTLSGSVPSRAEKLLAEKIAQSVEGVKRVENNLSAPEELQ